MSTPAIPVSSESSLKRFRKFTCPYIVADGDDAVDDDAGPSAFSRDLGEEFP
jgi:hypothetical protein